MKTPAKKKMMGGGYAMDKAMATPGAAKAMDKMAMARDKTLRRKPASDKVSIMPVMAKGGAVKKGKK